MLTASNPNRVVWIDQAGRMPLCDVPWLGTSIVHADGSVNFCCFSNGVVGNVNQHTFQEIWNGPEMTRIRETLIARELPAECQTHSCPIYRGDDLHYIFDRMDGPSAKLGPDPHEHVREALGGSALAVVASPLPDGGERITANIDLRFTGDPLTADLVVAVAGPEGLRFLPGFDDYAVPFQQAIALTAEATEHPIRLTLWSGDSAVLGPAGEYEFCAALFEVESNPNLLSNCFWSQSRTVTVQGRRRP